MTIPIFKKEVASCQKNAQHEVEKVCGSESVGKSYKRNSSSGHGHSIMSPAQHDPEEGLLVISPYTDIPHLLDLSTVGIEDQLLAKALTSFQCLREDYATAPYLETFNWIDVLAKVHSLSQAIEHTWKRQIYYIVVFRSQILPSTNYSNLGVLDKAAHAEAVKSGGFLK